MSVGTRIKERRKYLNMTQSQLAERLGITKGAVANYERGLSSPKAEILYGLFELLKCDANYIFQDYIPREYLSPEMELHNSIADLNSEGRHKLKDYMDDLVSSGRYAARKDGGASLVSERKTSLTKKANKSK